MTVLDVFVCVTTVW